jgi:hypothetical protein
LIRRSDGAGGGRFKVAGERQVCIQRSIYEPGPGVSDG